VLRSQEQVAMPEITLRHEIDTDEDTFWSKIVFDEAFNEKLYQGALKFPRWKLLEMNEGDAKITRKVQVEPPLGDLPGAVKKVVGDRLAYTEEGSFDKKAKRYSFKVTPSTLPDKTKVTGEMWCEPVGEKKIRRMCRILVEVKVFVVGGMIEDRIMADLRASYDNSTTYTNQILEETGL
jgi:hypothetical protein